MPVAVPLAMTAGSAIAGWLGNRPSAQAKALMSQQRDVARSQASLAKRAADFANLRFTLAEPGITRASQYYNQLASGNRSVMMSALNPELTALGDAYGGAAKGIGATLTGPARERALAELSRKRVGQTGSLIAGARSGAMANLLGITNDAVTGGSAAGSMLGGAGSAYGDITRTVADFDAQRRGALTGIAQSLANVWLPYLLQNSGKNPLGSKPIAPGAGNTPFYPPNLPIGGNYRSLMG